jgi:hypothetical protein
LLDGRQQQGKQHPDDGDRDKEFDDRKSRTKPRWYVNRPPYSMESFYANGSFHEHGIRFTCEPSILGSRGEVQHTY